MKSRSFLLTVFLLLGAFAVSHAQYNTPVDYMNAVTGDSKNISAKVWSYISASSHSKSTKKVEKSRMELLETISSAMKKLAKVPPYEGDASFRDSALMYLELSFHIFNEDYANIVNMEEVAEQSYDYMEAYMLAREKANDKLDGAFDMLRSEQQKFADGHNINLVEAEEDQQSKNMKIANEVYKYYNELYLIFFKSYKQEVFMMEAMQREDVNAVEQNKNSLSTYSKDGLTKIAALSSYKNDRSLIDAAKSMLEFYQKEADKDVAIITDYYLKKEKFDKLKAAFEAKKESSRTQTDVDQYNTGVKELNTAVNTFNATNQELNQKRAQYLDRWNMSVQNFLDRHVPN